MLLTSFFSLLIFLLRFPQLPPSFPLLPQLHWKGKGSVALTEPALPGVVLREAWLAFSREEREGEGTAGSVMPSAVRAPSSCSSSSSSTSSFTAVATATQRAPLFLRQQTDNPEAGESVETQPSLSPAQHSPA